MKHRPDPVAVLRAQSQAVGVPISGLQASKILDVESALRTRGVRTGAISARDADRLRERHILDSLRAAVAVLPADRESYDLGSGAGLPGLPIAIARPWARMTCIERRPRRAALVEWLIEQIGIRNATTLAGAIEEATEPVDVCFARALAPIERVWPLAEPLLRPSGRLVFFAGAASPPIVKSRGTQVRTLPTVGLERSGPLVIMSRE